MFAHNQLESYAYPPVGVLETPQVMKNLLLYVMRNLLRRRETSSRPAEMVGDNVMPYFKVCRNLTAVRPVSKVETVTTVPGRAFHWGMVQGK
ncbi:Hypp3010 [Branchiostoma lanceolatum]|uniref:Hypp3010 protein n=1 Tax=Branchiostoma lanceolatum TaxID=7740 RepID=A0A8J9ZVR7_BRALA|nr:Hypp3010 [Branchiostoma lanceolatum]